MFIETCCRKYYSIDNGAVKNLYIRNYHGASRARQRGVMREITVQGMRDYMIAAAIFAQGQSEIYYKSLTLIEDMVRRGCKPKIVDPGDVPENALVCQVWQRSGCLPLSRLATGRCSPVP